MTGFLQVCLYVFSGCAALGMGAALVLAARAGQRATAVLAFLIAVFVVFVLVDAAARL